MFSKVEPGGSVTSANMIPRSSLGINPEGVIWKRTTVIPENTKRATTTIHFLRVKNPNDLTYFLFILSKFVLKAMKNRSLKLALRCLESVCGFNSNAHKAGLKVNALTAEIKIAIAKVTANCW